MATLADEDSNYDTEFLNVCPLKCYGRRKSHMLHFLCSRHMSSTDKMECRSNNPSMTIFPLFFKESFCTFLWYFLSRLYTMLTQDYSSTAFKLERCKIIYKKEWPTENKTNSYISLLPCSDIAVGVRCPIS